jgi:hypothetical protein
LYPARSVRGVPSVLVVGAAQDKVADPVVVTDLTESAEVPVTLPDVAVMVVVPAATAVARPLDPAALLIDATPVLDEYQVTAVVRICVVLSENVPVAENC